MNEAESLQLGKGYHVSMPGTTLNGVHLPFVLVCMLDLLYLQELMLSINPFQTVVLALPFTVVLTTSSMIPLLSAIIT